MNLVIKIKDTAKPSRIAQLGDAIALLQEFSCDSISFTKNYDDVIESISREW